MIADAATDIKTDQCSGCGALVRRCFWNELAVYIATGLRPWCVGRQSRRLPAAKRSDQTLSMTPYRDIPLGRMPIEGVAYFVGAPARGLFWRTRCANRQRTTASDWSWPSARSHYVRQFIRPRRTLSRRESNWPMSLRLWPYDELTATGFFRNGLASGLSSIRERRSRPRQQAWRCWQDHSAMQRDGFVAMKRGNRICVLSAPHIRARSCCQMFDLRLRRPGHSPYARWA